MGGFDPKRTPAGWAANVRCGHGSGSFAAKSEANCPAFEATYTAPDSGVRDS